MKEIAAARRGSMAAEYTRAPKLTRRAARIRIDPKTSVRAVLTLPPAGVARPLPVALVMAHGAGSTMAQPLVVELADVLAERGALVLRFNFAYADRGKRAPDRPPLLIAAFRAAAAWLAERPEAKGRAFVLGGKSMGGRIATHLAALGDRADGVWLLGYPLHPAGRPEVMRDAHLGDVACPLLFLEGTRDPLCELPLLRPVLKRLGRRATLVVIEGGDHSFAVPKRTGRSADDVLLEIVDASARWLAKLKPTRPPRVPKPGRSPASSSARPRAGTKARARSSAARK